MSYAVSPVIPPHPDERPPVEAPVIPTFSPNSIPATPAWMGHPQAQANPAAFPSTPYPGVTPGSYFPPSSGLPPTTTPVVPQNNGGLSSDWTGYPHFGQDGRITGYHPYPQYIPATAQATPAMPPTATPMYAYAQPGATPWHPPPTFGTPFVAAGAVPGMMPGHMMGAMPGAMPGGMPGPMPGGMPMPGAMPGGMPGMMPGGMSGMMPGMMPGMMHTPFPGHPGLQPAQAAPAPPPPPVHRPMRSHEMLDRFDKFAEEHYGPVLDTFLAKAVDATMEINPLLAPPPERHEDRPYLKWNMLWPTGQCQKSTDPGNRSWSAGRRAPATWPRVRSIRLISRSFPWIIAIEARDPDEGVTCGDVMEGIHKFMYGRVSKSQMQTAPENQKSLLSRSYYHNRSTAPDVPGGRLEEALLRCDWLGLYTSFGGILAADEQTQRDLLHGAPLPCTFELKCLQRYPMTAEEVREQEARERATQEGRRSRRQSRAGSRAASSRAHSRNSRNPSVHTISSSSSTTSDTDS